MEAASFGVAAMVCTVLELWIPWLFLVVSAAGAMFTANALWPIRSSKWLVLPSFLLSMFAGELAAYHLIWQALVIGVLLTLGALEGLPGWIGLGLAGFSWLGLAWMVVRGHAAVSTIRAALQELMGQVPSATIPWWRVLVPFPLRLARARVVRNRIYARIRGQKLRLDVYLPLKRGPLRPAVVQIHGGAWVVGDKREQGVPLMTRLSDRGFVGFNVNYRLSPGATFPDHLVDIKRAIAWIRAHADEYGVDSSFIAVTGGSAGGHLAALTALTANDPRYQPGFEEADTSVQAAAPFYAIYDLTDRLGTHPPGFIDTLLEPLVIKAFFEEEPERFAEASPIDRVVPDAPPFFVIHGDRDTLAPLRDAAEFVSRLRDVSCAPVLFAEIPGAQHAFDLLVTPRSLPVIEGVGHFLEYLYEQHTQGRPGRDARVEEAPPRAPTEAAAVTTQPMASSAR